LSLCQWLLICKNSSSFKADAEQQRSKNKFEDFVFHFLYVLFTVGAGAEFETGIPAGLGVGWILKVA
jgi:hypothetical protein